MDKLPKEIIVIDTKRTNKPIEVVYGLEIFNRNADGTKIVAYTSEKWKECIELCIGDDSETEMLYRLSNYLYYGKKLDFSKRVNLFI